MESGATSDEEDLYKLLMQGYDFDEDEDDDDDYVDALVPDEALRDAATLASSRRKRGGSDDEDESGAATEASSVADDDDSDDSHWTNRQRYRRSTRLRKEHADLISEWQEAVVKEQDMRAKIYQKASEAASSMPKPADEAASVNGGSTSISSSSSSSSGSSSSSECSSSSRSLVPTRSLPSWLTEEAVASKGVRDRLSELLSRHAQMLLQVYLWYLREDAQPLPVTPGGEASLSQRAEKACRLLADLKYRRTESDDRRRFIATTFDSETSPSSSSSSSSSSRSSNRSSGTDETLDASEAASLAEKHAEQVVETAQAELVAGAKKAADAIAAAETAKQAMSAANTALQEALIHDVDLDAAQQSMTIALAQFTAAKVDAEKKKAGWARLKEAAARVVASPSSSSLSGRSSLLTAPLSPGSRRLTRSLARSAASASATRSFFHACRLYDPDQQLRRVEVEECSKVRCGDGDGPQLSQDNSKDGDEERDDAAFLRFKKCSSFVRLRMDALSAAADERYLPPEDPTLDPDGAGLLSIGSNRKLWLPSEDRLLLRVLTQQGSKVQNHWLDTGTLPYTLIASEVLASTKTSEEVKARIEEYGTDHPVKKALEVLDKLRAHNEKMKMMWTHADDITLQEAVKQYGSNNWTGIANGVRRFANQTPKDLQLRWKLILPSLQANLPIRYEEPPTFLGLESSSSGSSQASSAIGAGAGLLPNAVNLSQMNPAMMNPALMSGTPMMMQFLQLQMQMMASMSSGASAGDGINPASMLLPNPMLAMMMQNSNLKPAIPDPASSTIPSLKGGPTPKKSKPAAKSTTNSTKKTTTRRPRPTAPRLPSNSGVAGVASSATQIPKMPQGSHSVPFIDGSYTAMQLLKEHPLVASEPPERAKKVPDQRVTATKVAAARSVRTERDAVNQEKESIARAGRLEKLRRYRRKKRAGRVPRANKRKAAVELSVDAGAKTDDSTRGNIYEREDDYQDMDGGYDHDFNGQDSGSDDSAFEREEFSDSDSSVQHQDVLRSPQYGNTTPNIAPMLPMKPQPAALLASPAPPPPPNPPPPLNSVVQPGATSTPSPASSSSRRLTRLQSSALSEGKKQNSPNSSMVRRGRSSLVGRAAEPRRRMENLFNQSTTDVSSTKVDDAPFMVLSVGNTTGSNSLDASNGITSNHTSETPVAAAVNTMLGEDSAMGPMSLRGLNASPSALRVPAKPFSPPVSASKTKSKRTSSHGAAPSDAGNNARKSSSKNGSKRAEKTNGAEGVEMVPASVAYKANRSSTSKVSKSEKAALSQVAAAEASLTAPLGYYDEAEFSTLGASMGGFSPGASMGLDLTMTTNFGSPAKPSASGPNKSTVASLQSPIRRRSERSKDSPAANASSSGSNGRKMGRSPHLDGEARKKSPRMFEAIEREITGQSPRRSPRRT